MVLLKSPVCAFETPAPDFRLLGIDDQYWTLEQCRGPNGLLVMFICNHCPYVKAIQSRLVRDTAELRQHGIHSVAIMSNDPADYPEDSFDNMKRVAAELDYGFPYLIDETQAVAKAYGAVCTPDFFGYNADLKLQYRGRLDAGGREPAGAGSRRELLDAMTEVARSGRGPIDQTPSMGCSIKWRDA